MIIKMMDDAVEDRSGGETAGLITSVPVQMVTEARVEVVSKMSPVTVTSNSVQQDLITAQYINIHRVPAEQLNKVLVPDALSSELLSHHVDLSAAAADFTQHGVAAQYYDTDDLLSHDLTEEDRRLAAELVAVQLKHHQNQQTQILPTSIALGSVQAVNIDKPNVSAAIVTSYIQAVEEEVVHQQLLNQQQQADTNDRCIMKIYQQQPTTNDIQVLTRAQQSQPLPPLKKVLSSQSMVLRNRLLSAPTVMVELPNPPIMTTGRSINKDGLNIKVESRAMDKSNQNITGNIQTASSTGIQQTGHQVSVQSVGGTIATDELDSDYDAESDAKQSRRSLPHKKRIPRKLKTQPARSIHTKCYKCNKCGESFSTQTALSSHKVIHTVPMKQRNQNNVVVNANSLINSVNAGANVAAAAIFSCELCSKQFISQLKFFEHLKQHYEPNLNNVVNNHVILHSDNNVTNSNNHNDNNVHLNNIDSLDMNDVAIINSNGTASDNLPELTPAPIVATCIAPVATTTQQQMTTHEIVDGMVSVAATASSITTSTGSVVHHQTHLSVSSPHRTRSHLSHQQQQQSLSNAAFSIKDELGGQNVVKEEIVMSTGFSCNHCGDTFRRAKALETHINTVHTRQEEIEEFSEPEDMMVDIRHAVNITEVDSGDEAVHCVENDDCGTDDHCGVVDDKLRWRYQENIQELGMELQDMCLPLPAASSINSHHPNQGHHNTAVVNQSTVVQNHDPNHNAKDFDGSELNGKSLGLADKLAASNAISALANIENNGRKKQLTCPECDRTFNHRNSLLYHIRSHSGQRPHQCEVCGKSFFSASALKVHMRLHSGDKPYKCEFCNRHFRQWGDLKYHVTSLHSEQKQFQCEYCGKDFARKYSLIVHRRIHTGEKNYRCEYCSKTFRASSYLQNHRRIHTGEKPHACDVCGKPFRVRSDMKRHRQTHNRDRPARMTTASPTVITTSDQDEENSGGTESILPDTAVSTPLNLNIRQGDSNDGLTYTRTALEREGNTLYVWIPAQTETSLLPDE